MPPLLVFFDLETTGRDVDKDEIVQIAARANTDEREEFAVAYTDEPEEFSVFVLPSVEITRGASNVHGITRNGNTLSRSGRILPAMSMNTGLKVIATIFNLAMFNLNEILKYSSSFCLLKFFSTFP